MTKNPIVQEGPRYSDWSCCRGRPEATSIVPEIGQSDPQPLHRPPRATIPCFRESFAARGGWEPVRYVHMYVDMHGSQGRSPSRRRWRSLTNRPSKEGARGMPAHRSRALFRMGPGLGISSLYSVLCIIWANQTGE